MVAVLGFAGCIAFGYITLDCIILVVLLLSVLLFYCIILVALLLDHALLVVDGLEAFKA